MDKEMMQCLSKPFDPALVKIKPAQGGQKYIGHPLVTQRLNECDPTWHAEVLEMFHGQNGALAALRMALTVGGVTRIEVGGPQRNSGILNDLKNAHSDALKRCAMRFGVALGMWGELDDSDGDEDYEDNAPRNATRPVAPSNPVKDTSRPVVQKLERVDPVEASLTSGAANQRQLRYLQAVAREAGYDDHALDQLALKEFGHNVAAMSRSDATGLIDFIQKDALQAPAPPNAAPAATTTSKQDPEDPNSVLPTKRREAFIAGIFDHTKGQITATDLNNLYREQGGESLQKITLDDSRHLYNWILNCEAHGLAARRDELRRKYQPITDALRKKLFAISAEKCPTDIYNQGKDAADNFLHVQLFEHLGLGSVKDMSTYDVDKMVSIYEAGNFLDAVTV